ncbi:DNA-binding IclR family transcriptional regulator [Arthrobacter sp. CG_A4]|nr:DNA-binding IclR family transcriptional regulator [Arthrobacter sp. CG_A4]
MASRRTAPSPITASSRGRGQSLGEREPGVASVSAPVRGPSGRVNAAVSISGPVERLTRQPGRLLAEVVCNAARVLTEALRKTND